MNAKCSGLVCRDCGTKLAESEFSLTCPKCGAPMRVEFPAESIREALKDGMPAYDARSYLHQWRSILPISDDSLIDRVSLGETETPLLPQDWPKTLLRRLLRLSKRLRPAL